MRQPQPPPVNLQTFPYVEPPTGFNPHEEHLDLCNIRPFVGHSFVAKTLTLDITRYHFNQIVSYLPCKYAPCDFYHLIALSVTLTSPGGHKVSA